MNDINSQDTLNIKEELPPLTPWRYLFSPSIPFWKFDDQFTIRINLSREAFFPFYLCYVILFTGYMYFYFVLKNYMTQNQDIVFYLMTVTCVMTALCYAVTHYTNPGILPWHWATTKQRIYSKDELKSGIATTKEQKNWGKTHDWPIRSFFSGDSGYIILRADHSCFWINHWIGLKNHKFYIQSLFYCSSFLCIFLFSLINVYFNPRFNKKSILYIWWIIIIIFFAFHHLLNFVASLYRVYINQTIVEGIIGEPLFYGKGAIKNFEEIFGSIKLFPLWFLPISIPLPNDGFNYMPRPDDYCSAQNRQKRKDAVFRSMNANNNGNNTNCSNETNQNDQCANQNCPCDQNISQQHNNMDANQQNACKCHNNNHNFNTV